MTCALWKDGSGCLHGTDWVGEDKLDWKQGGCLGWFCRNLGASGPGDEEGRYMGGGMGSRGIDLLRGMGKRESW